MRKKKNQFESKNIDDDDDIVLKLDHEISERTPIWPEKLERIPTLLASYRVCSMLR